MACYSSPHSIKSNILITAQKLSNLECCSQKLGRIKKILFLQSQIGFYGSAACSAKENQASQIL
jgi:hypothetical protein